MSTYLIFIGRMYFEHIYLLMIRLFLFFCIVVGVCSCRTILAEVDKVLSLASVNKGELKKVLRHYGWCEQDSLKFRAACFLIGNMRWHFSHKKVTEIDPLWEEYCWRVDSVIYDPRGIFFKQNNIPTDKTVHVFLLDGGNKVLAVGDPVKNMNIFNLYMKLISKQMCTN